MIDIFISDFDIKFKVPVTHQELEQIIYNIAGDLKDIENKEWQYIFKSSGDVICAEKVLKSAITTYKRRKAEKLAGNGSNKTVINLKLNKYECLWLYKYIELNVGGSIPLSDLQENRVGPYIAHYIN